MRRPDHVHPDYWTERDQERFEDRITDELREMRRDLKQLATRFAWLLGALGVLVFVVNIAATIWLRFAGS